VRADAERLARWLRRSRPPRTQLVPALLAGLVASLVNVLLLVGAVGLLVTSASRPGLRSVLGVLIVIELFAFFRSPLRFAERLSAHRLGFDAVSRWRRWLFVAIGRLTFRQWRSFAAGDLLERALRDTDELQDLWLRCVIPLSTSVVVMVLSDLFIGLLPPHGGWWSYAGDLFAIQLLGVIALFANVGPLLRRNRALRAARSLYRAEVVELSAVTPDLALLQRVAFAQGRSALAVERLARAERRQQRQQQLSNVVPPAMTALALGAYVVRPSTSPLWLVVVALVALSTLEMLSTIRDALDTALGVSAAAERLDALDVGVELGHESWPSDSTIRVEHVVLEEDGEPLVIDANLVVAPGRRVALTGPSGVGKSTFLRSIAGLDSVASGDITIGATRVLDIDEPLLRRSLTYVPSEPGLTRGFAIDVLGLGRAATRDSLDDLAALGLTTETATRWEELSRGERARVAVARAMRTSPSIYLLDELTSGLGESETASMLTLLESTGATIVIASHDAQVIEWCDEVFELSNSTLRRVTR
jgi:ABC-type transport system involved in cytochrome bd biosynthesis fused ATPase/permease subunit